MLVGTQLMLEVGTPAALQMSQRDLVFLMIYLSLERMVLSFRKWDRKLG